MFKPEFEPGDFLRVNIPQEPGISIATVITGFHDLAPFIDRRCILGRAPHTDKLGNAVGVETFKTADGSFRADQAGVGDKEIRAAMDPTWGGLPQDAVAVNRLDVFNDPRENVIIALHRVVTE